VAMINALVEADAYYRNLSDPVGVDPELVNAGEIAQNALVAAFVTAIEPPASWWGDPLDIGAYVFDLLTDPLNTDPPDSFTTPNTSAGYLGNILSAAGIVF
jgi:hypothetical protein